MDNISDLQNNLDDSPNNYQMVLKNANDALDLQNLG